MVNIDQKEALVDYEHTLNIYNYPAVNEFATSPAAKSITVDLMVDSFALKSKRGVTVKQVLLGVAKMWDQPVPPGVGWGGGEDWEEDLDLRGALGDRNGWQGWDAALATSNGRVILSTSGYDS